MHILDIHIHSSSYIFCSISGEDRKAQLRIKFCKQRDDSSFPRIFVVQVLEPLRSVRMAAEKGDVAAVVPSLRGRINELIESPPNWSPKAQGGSFSAVSTPIVASTYSLESSKRDL